MSVSHSFIHRFSGSNRKWLTFPHNGAQLSLSMVPAAGLPCERAADFFGKRVYLCGCGGHAGIFDDAKRRRNRLPQCNTMPIRVAVIGDTGAGKISGNVFGEPRTRRHSIVDNKCAPPLVVRHFERFRRRSQIKRRWLNGNHHEPCRADRDPRLGFGVRRSVQAAPVRPFCSTSSPELRPIRKRICWSGGSPALRFVASAERLCAADAPADPDRRRPMPPMTPMPDGLGQGGRIIGQPQAA